jgi:hypothetical protein
MLACVERHGNITSRALIDEMTKAGREPRSVQRAIRISLDRGQLALGKGLRLYVTKQFAVGIEGERKS